MPNWCSTRIVILNEDKIELKRFYDNIIKWSSSNYCENGFGESWLGNIVGNSGLETLEDKVNGNFKIRCRGSISDISYVNGEIHFTTETAWAPMLKMWQLLMEKHLPNGDLIFESEEPGYLLYATNDPDMIGKYVIDVWDWDAVEYESNWEADEDEVVDFLQEHLKSDETDINKLLELFNNSELSESCAINKWEEADITDFE